MTPDGKNKKLIIGATSEKKANAPKDAKKATEASLNSTLVRGVWKAAPLRSREALEFTDDAALQVDVAERLDVVQRQSYNVSGSSTSIQPSGAEEPWRPCVPIDSRPFIAGGAFVGVSAEDAGWDLKQFLLSFETCPESEFARVYAALSSEYSRGGQNDVFRSALQGSVCFLGCASEERQEAYSALGLGNVRPGSSVGAIDCHLGGNSHASTEQAACVRYDGNSFEIQCMNSEDLVMVNGAALTPGKGFVSSLAHGDVCCVGPRVFIFVVG